MFKHQIYLQSSKNAKMSQLVTLWQVKSLKTDSNSCQTGFFRKKMKYLITWKEPVLTIYSKT